MWSIAIYDFGLTEEQFWRLTFRQFYALSKRHNHDLVRWDHHFGVVASTIANCNRDPKKKRDAWEPKDFVPDRAPARKLRKTSKAIHEYWKQNVLTAFNVTKKACADGPCNS